MLAKRDILYHGGVCIRKRWTGKVLSRKNIYTFRRYTEFLTDGDGTIDHIICIFFQTGIAYSYYRSNRLFV